MDRYTKVVLTVIATALVWLCLWGPGPARFGTPAEAKTKPKTSPILTYMEPGIKGVVILGVATTSGVEQFRKTGNLNYVTTKGGVIPVSGFVDAAVTGGVDINNPVEVKGTVDIDQPVKVKGDVDVSGTVSVSQPVRVTGSVDVDGTVEIEGAAGGYPVKVRVSEY